MWNIKIKIIPVITGDTGTISKSFIKHFNNATGEHKIKELQKISHIGHCTHTGEIKVKKNLSLQVWTGSSGSREMKLPEFLAIRHL
jgi:dTDP-D-glucose 4,6-dehydratase